MRGAGKRAHGIRGQARQPCTRLDIAYIRPPARHKASETVVIRSLTCRRVESGAQGVEGCRNDPIRRPGRRHLLRTLLVPAAWVASAAR